MKVYSSDRIRRLTGLVGLWLVAALLNGCATPAADPSSGHITAPAAAEIDAQIPPTVRNSILVPKPVDEPQAETYTVVVDNVPVRELLFALARDAGVNIDIHPGIDGNVTLNAVEQTLTQILDRVAQQVALRYQIKQRSVLISPDTPYWKTYKVPYVNVRRDSAGNVSITTQIASTGSNVGAEDSGGGGDSEGSNNSTTTVSTVSDHRFWDTLVENILALLDYQSEESSADAGAANSVSGTLLVNAESGLLTVRATDRQQRQIQDYLNLVLQHVRRQILIEATVVEVRLSDMYQSGVDWTRLSTTGDITLTQSVLGENLADAPFFLVEYAKDNLTASVRMLEEFGDVKVLSSPKIMALNNQTAVLKVVDNRVYFTVEADTSTTEGVSVTTFTTSLHTVPVGFVMQVTPQVDGNEVVTLNVRPTISRIIGFVNDPNPSLAAANVVSPIPEIQVREMETVIKVNSGQTAVMGGLMQNAYEQTAQGIPFLSRVPGVKSLFSVREDDFVKTELVIFLRPISIHQPSLDGDFRPYRHYLPKAAVDPAPVFN